MTSILDRERFWQQIDAGESPSNHGLKITGRADLSTLSTASPVETGETEDAFFARQVARRKSFELGLAATRYAACPWAATTPAERAAACGEPVFSYDARKIDAYRERLRAGAAEIATEIEKTQARAIATEIDRARRAGLKL